jgi:uncharacterized protein YhfF
VLLVPEGAAWRLPEVTANGARPLAALTDAVRDRLGIALPHPVGLRAATGTAVPNEFVFLVDKAALPAASRVVPLAEAVGLADVFDLYVDTMLGGWMPPRRDLDVFFFGNAPEMAARLAHLVRCGRKRATAGWLRAARLDGSTVPTPGLVSVVTDGYGVPQAVIETVELIIKPLRDVPAALAAEEGEGDLSLDDWREGHLAFFNEEARTLGLAFTPEEDLFIERFRVLHLPGRASGH